MRKNATFKIEVICVTQAVHTMIIDCPIPYINDVLEHLEEFLALFTDLKLEETYSTKQRTMNVIQLFNEKGTTKVKNQECLIDVYSKSKIYILPIHK